MGNVVPLKRTAAVQHPQERIAQWRADPVAFVEFNWPGVLLEPFQREALTALEDNGRVSIRSGHGVGKSTLDAWCVLWFMSTRFPCKVPCTAPTKHQIEDVLHAEIATWLNANEFLKASFELKKERLELIGAANESFAAFRTGSKANPDALQGFHSKNVLFVLDEASGIDDSVFEVAEGALSTPDARVLMTGNPTRRSGFFYESHHGDRASWHTLKVSCTDSSIAALDYVERMKRFGETSNIYRVRVLGEFPISDDDAVIPLETVEAAVGREVETVKTAPVLWGLDVARFGDDRTALAKRKGNTLLGPIQSWRHLDLMQVAGRVKNEYEDARQKPELVLVDVIGLGAGVVDRLKELDVPVRGVNVAESASSRERFMRLRDEVWFKGREWFASQEVSMPDDPDLISELTQVGYRVESTGKIRVDSKEQMKRDGRSSPDLADAFLLTFAGPTKSASKKTRKQLNYDLSWVV